ncbi:MAG: GntR family transcriptional regulator, partial [Anaerolineae bacterium]
DNMGVSRTTVRDALCRLENEGVVYRKQGAGTFVNPPGLQIKSRLEEIWSYEGVLQAHGYTPRIRLLSLETMPAPPEVAQKLGLAAKAPVLAAEKLFLEDDKPAILVRNFIPSALITRPYQPDDCQLPVYEFLSQFCQQSLNYYLSELAPVVADGGLAEKLDVVAGTAVLSFAEIGYNDDNQPILTATSYFRDDLLRFRIMRRQT